MRNSSLLLLISVSASASPYFRPIDFNHPQPVLGALIAPDGLNKTSGVSLLPLITHSPKDGCLLPAIICEDYTPLAVGASIAAGKLTLDVAPLANVLPWMVALVAAVTPSGWTSPIGWLKPDDGQAVTFSAGPVFEYRQITNKGYYRTFAGLALHF